MFAFPLYYSFLKKAAWSGVLVSFLLCIWTVQFIPIWVYLWDGLFDKFDQVGGTGTENYWTPMNYCAISVQIAFGAIVGKVNGFQIMWVGLIFGFIWELNYALNHTVYYSSMQGLLNEMWIFSSTFGVVTAWILGPHGEQGTSNENYASGKKTTVFSWIGAAFLIT